MFASLGNAILAGDAVSCSLRPKNSGNAQRINEYGPTVSVIVPTKNSATTLRRCLSSIRAQTHPNIEIVVVDNFSSDATGEIAKEFGCKFLKIGPERSAQMNEGVKSAAGKYIYIVGSDFYLEPDVVSQAVFEAESHQKDAVLIHNTSDDSVSFWAKVRKLERDCYEGDNLNVAAFFMQRKVYLSLGGYDERLVAGEDYDLHNRIISRGYTVGTIKAREIHFGEPRSLSEIVRKHVYYGRTIGNYLAKSGTRGLRQMSFIRPSYLRHGTVFLKNPGLTLGFLVYQYVRYLSAFFGLVCQQTDIALDWLLR